MTSSTEGSQRCWVCNEETHQNMPDVLVCSLVAAEAHAGSEQALSAPQVAGHHKQVTHLHAFDAVHLHFHQVANVDL